MISDFEEINYSQLKSLVITLYALQERTLERIESSYNRVSLKFSQTFAFATKIDLLHSEREVVSINPKLISTIKNDKISNTQLKPVFCDLLLNTRGCYYQETQEYLTHFRKAGMKYEFVPLNENRSEYKGIRNLFIEIGIVKYDSKLAKYYLAQRYLNLTQELINRRKLTPEKLKIEHEKKEELGYRAELAIIEYEKKRLLDNKGLAAQIDHIAKYDVEAGFDILSYDIQKKSDQIENRYIEVKAISSVKTEFYWSINEIETAKKYRSQYYLYLLTVINDNIFDIDKLVIIRDPFMEVFSNEGKWVIDANSYHIIKRK